MTAGRTAWALPLVVLFLTVTLLPAQIEAGPIRLSLTAIMMLAAFLPLVGLLLAGRLGPVLPTDGLLTLHVLLAALALTVNSPDRAATAAGSHVLDTLAPYLLARAVVRTGADFTAVVLATGLAVICTLPFAVIEALTHRDVLLRLLEAIPNVTMPAETPVDLRLGLDRVQAGFGHPILYGIFCSLSVTLVLVGLKETLPTALRLTLAALVLLACFLSLSSGALLAVAVQFGLLAWNAMLRPFPWRWWALAGGLMLAYAALALVVQRPVLHLFLTHATFNPQNGFYRELILEWGTRSVAAHPWLGIGLQDWVRPSFMVSPTVDNFWLLTAMRYGLPALGALVLAYAVGLLQVARHDRPADARLRLGWLVTMAGLGFSLLTVHVWGEAQSFIFFLFGAGMWMSRGAPKTGRLASLPYTRFPSPITRG